MKRHHLPSLGSGNRIDRRAWLRRVGLGSFGCQLWSMLQRPTAFADTTFQPGQGVPGGRKIRSCIFLFLYGGPSHLDTFDLKPDAPGEVRGEFKPIATSAAGIQICEHLPLLSKWMHRGALIRSMYHSNRLHDSASIETFTGRPGPNGDREEFAPIPQFFPCHGAVIHHAFRGEHRDVHHAVLPWLFHNVIDVPCQGGGFLGSRFNPFPVAGDPAATAFRSTMLQRPDELTLPRISERRHLLNRLNTHSVASLLAAQQMNSQFERAYDLLDSPAIRDALVIEREPEAIRQRYGLGQERDTSAGTAAALAAGKNLRGQSLLMARRLVEAGVPFINVNDYRQQGQNWDSHSGNFDQHKEHLLPALDRGLSALIEDLEMRGLLEETLVVVTGEFGRTPMINSNAGRDHWPDCYTTLLFGGGIAGGQVHGSSDKIGSRPDSDPVSPADIAATLYWRFGIDPHAEILDPTNRPYRLSEGIALKHLFG